MTYKPQRLPEWADVIAAKDAEIARLRAIVEQVAPHRRSEGSRT